MSKLDLKNVDTSSLIQAKKVLENANADYVVIDVLNAIKEELKTRDPKEEKDEELFLKLDLNDLSKRRNQ